VHIFLDESGGLGFDFTKGGTTRFFVVCLLTVPTSEDRNLLAQAVERTIRHKLHHKKAPRHPFQELKGSKTDLDTKQYFYRQAVDAKFTLYTLIVNKAKTFQSMREKPERLYTVVARELIEHCPLPAEQGKIVLTLDRRIAAKEIQAFNQSLLVQIQKRLPVNVPFEIFHQHSFENRGLQAVDLFSWGIFRKYERGDESWYAAFKDRLAFEEVY